MLIYDGPSLYDGEPIIVLAHPDHNRKTGTMLSTWVLLRDRPPEDAGYDGGDSSICGSCRYRWDGERRRCYVRLHREPAMLWDKYRDGEYELATDFQRVNPLRMPVRIGSYGDPAAVPTSVWAALAATATRWTGYTHLWRWSGVDPELRHYCMASVDSLEERSEAQDRGWRTFLVLPEGEQGPERDILCPASKLAGRRTTCDCCRLCMGLGIGIDRSIWIPLHGPGK